jgi:hypothetical protein
MKYVLRASQKKELLRRGYTETLIADLARRRPERLLEILGSPPPNPPIGVGDPSAPVHINVPIDPRTTPTISSGR